MSTKILIITRRYMSILEIYIYEYLRIFWFSCGHTNLYHSAFISRRWRPVVEVSLQKLLVNAVSFISNSMMKVHYNNMKLSHRRDTANHVMTEVKRIIFIAKYNCFLLHLFAFFPVQSFLEWYKMLHNHSKKEKDKIINSVFIKSNLRSAPAMATST